MRIYLEDISRIWLAITKVTQEKKKKLKYFIVFHKNSNLQPAPSQKNPKKQTKKQRNKQIKKNN